MLQIYGNKFDGGRGLKFVQSYSGILSYSRRLRSERATTPRAPLIFALAG